MSLVFQNYGNLTTTGVLGRWSYLLYEPFRGESRQITVDERCSENSGRIDRTFDRVRTIPRVVLCATTQYVEA
jgi:hypothetical protein